MPEVKLTRHLPGVSAKGRDGQVLFVRGTVLRVSEYSIKVETDSKMIGIQTLIGETYIYYCPNCKTSVWEVERVRSKGACPHCHRQLSFLQAGDKVRLHYRHQIQRDQHQQMISGGGAWWGERFDW